MNKNSKRLTVYVILMLALAIAACILRTLACVRDLEDNLIYFSNGAANLASGIVVSAGAVLLFSAAFTQKKVALRASFSTPMTYVPTGAVAISLFALAIRLFIHSKEAAAPLTVIRSLGNPAVLLAIISALLAFTSIAHFFFTAFLTQRHTVMRGYFALATILFLAAYSSYLYFDISTPINAPGKVVDQMAYLFTAIFFLYEARISLGREMWRGYTAFGLVSALLLAYSSIPTLLTYAITGNTVSASIEAAVFSLALFLFVFTRLALAATVREEGEAAVITVLRENARNHTSPHCAPTEVIEDEHQITMDELFGPLTQESENTEDAPESDATADEEREGEPVQIEFTVETEASEEALGKE